MTSNAHYVIRYRSATPLAFIGVTVWISILVPVVIAGEAVLERVLAASLFGAVLVGMAVFQGYRIVVVATLDGLVVRNHRSPLRYLNWHEIEDFRICRSGIEVAICVMLDGDGEVLTLHATTPLLPTRRSSQQLHQDLGILRSLLSENRLSSP